ncbi:hypothetical protein M8C21_019246 [Ambrosia artemisiifolia]|uniref:Uncharacterized protein n=1 Tax=Ambrosia artemisiifolia TaxID=4212 RepID=A0AAD5GC62_AMBAR|nr:hypothetical protein M8C21_019246 [Ambrosia artemisiifolia]
MELTHVHTLNIRGVLSVSKRIILARYWHFISLSLFFLPLFISPTLIHRLSYQPFTHNHLITYLVTILVFVLALCATGTITYSTHHAFFGEPITFLDSLKSLTFSFFPLAFTAIIAYVLIVLISITFLMLVSAALMLVQSLVFVIDYNSVYFFWFSAIMGAILIAIVIYFYVEWSLAFVVVMVESKWGFSALMRSAYLVKGMRSVSLLVILYFGLCGAGFVLICSTSFNNGWPFGLLVFNTMLASFFLMMCLLRLTAANTVLYNYCKALHSELELEVGQGFVHEYMNLPSGDGW